MTELTLALEAYRKALLEMAVDDLISRVNDVAPGRDMPLKVRLARSKVESLATPDNLTAALMAARFLTKP